MSREKAPDSDDDPKTVVYQLRVRPETRSLIEGLREKLGTPAAAIAARVFTAFVGLDEASQRAILQGEQDAAYWGRLRQVMDGSDIENLSVDDAVERIQTLLRHVQNSNKIIDHARKELLARVRGKAK